MVTSSTGTPAGILRRALRHEVGAASLRRVSRQVGMSPTGLRKFLDGARPYSATRRRLERWYLLHGPGRPEGEMRGEAALAVLRVLVQDLAPPRHRPSLERLAAALGEAYDTAGVERPRWLGELHEALEHEVRG
jgi:hypothetical protein